MAGNKANRSRPADPAVGRMAASVAHEINNSLQAVMGCAKELHEGRVSDGMQEAYQHSIQEGLLRIRKTVRWLVAYARDQELPSDSLHKKVASPMLEILLVDDEDDIRMPVRGVLTAAGHKVTEAADGAQALERIKSQVFDLMISDIRMPRMDGISVFRQLRREAPGTDAILMTAYGGVEEAVAALKEGADDYLIKPVDLDEIAIRVQRIAERRTLNQELARARSELAARSVDTDLVGKAPVMTRLRQRIETVASSDAPVLILGESGTGKELVARRLHELSPRNRKPFVAVNCAAFPESLIEAELFGHERGAFTGAVKRREGRFKAADGGTLFLDEVAEIPLPTQAKLLRVLQQGMIEPLGQNAPVQVDVRIVSATHRNLKRHIAEGRFREDLYYRLNVLDIALPPLRERRGDLPILVEHFLRQRTTQGEQPSSIAPRAWAALSDYPYPGNVRELEHAIQHALVLSRGKEIGLEHLPADIVGVARGLEAEGAAESFRPLATAVREFEREHLLRALAVADGKKSRAAELLGISRKNLWEKLRGHGIDGSDMEE